VLFSEPKIPQARYEPDRSIVVGFQCSSASRKFLNNIVDVEIWQTDGFSALQRAENSSTGDGGQVLAVGKFQCSSASRKFLNRWGDSIQRRQF